MFSRLPGAFVRAVFVVLLVATPSLVLADVSTDAAQIVLLVAFFAAGLTIFEYASTYPGLVEFRDAPPYNRIRFISLFAMVLLISVIYSTPTVLSVPARFVSVIGSIIGNAMDLPYSPVRLVVLMLPETAPSHDVILLRSAAGLAYLISLMSLAAFLIVLRLTHWPSRGAAFNVWINLPTFDPTTGGDVVERLERDARFNVFLGFLLPFVTPPLFKFAATIFGSLSLANDQTLIWALTAWAFLPASLFMRGIAMQKVATMITGQRARHVADDCEPGAQPA
ncbi:MAG TPA: hypothetical protein ENK63_02955 [Rhodobacterales bacterium]|nr:hypothetical protein [Rhodobacterales bacterium]